MTTSTVPTTRFRDVVVTIACPEWCTTDHAPTRGFDDVWHSRDLTREDQDTYVSLTLSEVAVAIAGTETPDVSIMVDGNFVEVDRDWRWTRENMRRLSAMLNAAAEALDEMGAAR